MMKKLSILLIFVLFSIGCGKKTTVEFVVNSNYNGVAIIQYRTFGVQTIQSKKLIPVWNLTVLKYEDERVIPKWTDDYHLEIIGIYKMTGQPINFNPNDASKWTLDVIDNHYQYTLVFDDSSF